MVARVSSSALLHPKSAMALVVAHDKNLLSELCSLVRRAGLSPVEAKSAAQAIWIAEQNPPSLVLTDWLVTPKLGDSSPDLLKVLARSHSKVPVIVYTSAIGSPEIGSAICAAHPAALIHDDAYGFPLLSQRIERIMGKNLADLTTIGNSLVHAASGAMFPHKVGVQLLLAYPNAVTVDRSARTGLHRLRRWLEQQRSPVTVVNEPHMSRYRMHINVAGSIARSEAA